MATKIKANEILLENPQPIFGISDKKFLQLYYFFKKYNRSDNYIVEYDNVQLEDNTVKLFQEYGIYFEDYNSDSTNFVAEKQFIIIPDSVLTDMDTLQSYLETFCIKEIMPGMCIIEKSYKNVSAEIIQQEFQLVQSLLPTCTILNNRYEESGILDSSSAFEKLKQTVNKKTGELYRLVEISKYFNEFDSILNINQYLNKVTVILDTIKGLPCDDNTIYYVDNTRLGITATYAYYAIAAYLLLDSGIKCYVPLKDFEFFIHVVNRARNQNYMFLNDYLNSLANYPDFSVSCRSNQCYLWVKDSKKMNNPALRKKYSINLTLFKAKVDIDNFELLEDFTKTSSIIPLSSLTSIKRFRDFSDIGSTDITAAKDAYVKLNKLFFNMTTNLMELKILGNEEYLTVNNVLLYEQGGSHYVAYVSDINGSIPFVVFPLIEGYTAFTVDFDIKDLERLYDAQIFYDIDIWCDKIRKSVGMLNEKKQYYDRDTLKGILFAGYKEYNECISSDAPLTFAQIGLWSHQTGDFRLFRRNSFSNLFNKKMLLQENFFSIFGFKHPQISNEFTIKDEYWRYANC